MTDPFADKSTVAEIRDRFDNDVERFSIEHNHCVRITGND